MSETKMITLKFYSKILPSDGDSRTIDVTLDEASMLRNKNKAELLANGSPAEIFSALAEHDRSISGMMDSSTDPAKWADRGLV